MNKDYPNDPESWKTMALRSGISTDMVLNDLKLLEKRPMRYTGKNGMPRNKVASLSGSTARLEDTFFLRAMVKKVNHDKALDFLTDSKYADQRSWDMALECLGLQSVGKDLEPIAVTAESEGGTLQHDIGIPAGSRRPTMAQETFGTPVQQKTEPGTPQIPQAPKKGASRDRPRYVEGTEAFHRFMDALCPKTESHEFHKTAKSDVYGGFKTALSMYRAFQPWQMTDPANNVPPRRLLLSNRPAGSDSPRPTAEPVRRLVGKLQQATPRGWHDSPTPGARSRGKGVQEQFFSNNPSTAEQPTVDAENEDEDEDGDDGEPRTPNRFPDGEVTISTFACNFTIELAAIRSSLPANQILALIPIASNFCFGYKSHYAVNARVDGVVHKASFKYSDTMSKSDLTGSHLLTAEFKAHKDSLITNQIIFEFAAIISTIYSAGG